MSEHVFTRQMFCERCHKAGRPYSGLKFIVSGSTGFHIRKVDRWVAKEERGFTPHLVSAYKMIGDSDIAISRVCGIVGCGLTIEPDPADRNKLLFTYRKVSYDQIRLVDWNSLVENKDWGYKL